MVSKGELQFRRECILNTIASIQRHFLGLYSSRVGQCKLGYDTSLACDAFQLGQMLKFFTSKNLAYIADFSPSSLDDMPDSSTLDIEEILATLRQSPSYQIDGNHTNCGLRTRLDPILDFMRTMIASQIIAITPTEWRNNREAVSWRLSHQDSSRNSGGQKFEFTRALAGDQRFRLEGAMFTNKVARKLFTASSWDWTPEP
jgi:hypothetical protein